MRVEIQNERIVIGEQSLSFYGYYFDIEAYQEESTYKRLEQTRHDRASFLSNLGEPLKRSVMFLYLW